MNNFLNNNLDNNSGIILIDKPKGITSYQVVEILKKITNIKKIGHSGTLDPLAQGLMILAISRQATKKISLFLKSDKEYIATLKLGFVSNTFDKEGEINKKETKKIPSEKEIKTLLLSFLGEIEQTPPIFSAKKVNGKRAYFLARQGRQVKLKPQKVKIKKIRLLKYKFPLLRIKVKCSSGTYIRSLVSDIGEKLGCGAYLEELIRTKIGQFSLKDAISFSQLNSKNWMEYLIKI